MMRHSLRQRALRKARKPVAPSVDASLYRVPGAPLTVDEFFDRCAASFDGHRDAEKPLPTRILLHPESYYELMRVELFRRMLTYTLDMQPTYEGAAIVCDVRLSPGVVVFE